MTSDNEDEESEEYDDVPSVSPSADSSVDPSEFLFEHHSCFAHVLQLVVKDGMAKAGQIATVIKKCSNLVSFVQRSTLASDALKSEDKICVSCFTGQTGRLRKCSKTNIT